jgi:hypothetical protein
MEDGCSVLCVRLAKLEINEEQQIRQMQSRMKNHDESSEGRIKHAKEESVTMKQASERGSMMMISLMMV